MVTRKPRRSVAVRKDAQQRLQIRYANGYHGLFSMVVWCVPAQEYAMSIGWSGMFDEATLDQCELFNAWMDDKGWAR